MNFDVIAVDQYFTILIAGLLLFLAFLILKKEQDGRLNMAMFFSGLWTLVAVYMVDLWCVDLGYWNYGTGQMPFHFLFIWVMLWAVIPVYLSKTKFPLLIALVLLGIDILLMPELAARTSLSLSDEWWQGEILMVSLVCFPSLIWAKAYFKNNRLWLRNLMQVLTFGVLFLFIVPNLTPRWIQLSEFNYRGDWKDHFILGVFAAIPWSIPGLLGVKELLEKGKGTAFPYDPTTKLVRNGIYAYIKNPIQLSSLLAIMALVLTMQHFTLLIAILSLLVYSIGFAGPIERQQMTDRFGDKFTRYDQEVRSWWAHWRPRGIAHAKIYFKEDCSYCQALRRWLEVKNGYRLEFLHAHQYEGQELTALTYLDEDGNEYHGVRALAHGLGHVNFLWAFAGWMLRLPLIIHLLQLIIDYMDLTQDDACSVPE